MATLVTIETAAERTGKSVRSIWRYAAKLDEAGEPVFYAVPGINRTMVDYELVAREALSQRRGNPRFREQRTARENASS